LRVFQNPKIKYAGFHFSHRTQISLSYRARPPGRPRAPGGAGCPRRARFGIALWAKRGSVIQGLGRKFLILDRNI
jgi:hypothetical protein